MEGARTIPLTAEHFTNDLESLIVAQKLKPGMKLVSERQLAEQYGLSRPAVREGLRRLQERGLIVVHPGRGSFVTEARPTWGTAPTDFIVRRGKVTARELARARLMLECETAALAAEHRTDEQLEAMRAILVAIHDETGVPEKADLDLAFHEQIAEASGNLVLQIMFGSIRSLSHGTMLRSLSDSEVSERGEPLHDALLDAIEQQDPEAARATMAEHLHLAEVMYGRDLDEPLVDVLRRRVNDSQLPADAWRSVEQIASPEEF